ncbi:MAG: PilZ domain-containing protein [Pseudomonadota bacterium]
MTESDRSEREYFRAPARLRIVFGPDTMAGRQAMAMDTEMWVNQSQLESAARQVLEDASVAEGERPLLSVLRWMDFKIDLVLHHLRLREHALHFPHQGMTTDISGSGVGLEDNVALTVGGSVLVALYLPDNPSRPVYAGADVVRVEANQPGAKAALRFKDLAESDRERVIRFGFTQQRRMLAQRMEDEV